MPILMFRIQWLTEHDAGSLVPISLGRMRNEWFPRGVAEYVTQPELRTLRMSNTAVERDVEYGVTDLAAQAQAISKANKNGQYDDDYSQGGMTVRKAAEVEKVSPERSMQLIDIFVPKILDFYRQPLPEEPKEPEPEPKREEAVGRGAAAELFAARQRKDKPKAKELKGIYGSVSTQDILTAVRAALENNEESARVAIAESDIKFINAGTEIEEMGRVKTVGSYVFEVAVKNAETPVRRTMRVHAQEL